MNASHYTERYQTLTDALPGQNLPWLNTLRQLAVGSFAATGFPSPRMEEWKYTNVTALEKKRFQPVLSPTAVDAGIDLAWLDTHKLADTWSMVLVDGIFQAGLSDLNGLPDSVIVLDMAEALRVCPERMKALLGSALKQESHGFLAFNTAYFTDGVLIDIPKGVILDKPIHILHIASRNEALSNTRNLIHVGVNAQASVIETFVGMPGLSYLRASVSELVLADNAQLEHYKLLVETDKAYHFGGIYVKQNQYSRLTQHNLSFNGLLARHEIHGELADAAECEMNGLYLAKDRQHVDNHTLIHHNEPHGISRETYRGVLTDRARGVFQGRVVVHPQAQKTSAEMNNRNLLLSDDAEIDAKPQLEILADDVKCSHGVAIGQLAAESVFYLVSRGIDEATAKNMLTFAFANEMVDKIPFNPLRGRVQEHLLNLFPQTGIRRDWL